MAKQYKPSKDELEKIQFVYKEMDDMIEIRQRKYGEFNDRTLLQFIDDSQKRANGYVPSRESQGKMEWQANVFTKTTRNKVKGICASVSKDVPEMSLEARNWKNETSGSRAELMKDITTGSYNENGGNPEIVNFFDSWNLCINGTVIKYDGFLKTTDKIKRITAYDLSKGIIEYSEKEEYIEDRPIEINIPVQNLFVKNIYIHDIQDQSALIWVDYVDREHLEQEFQNWKNFNFIPSFSNEHSESETQTFFMDKWKDRGRVDQYEVIRYYSKPKDIYRIVINGVMVFDGPLLWGRRKKLYPFAKQVFEPMANSDFFYGNSLPNILMDEQDVKNALINSFIDQEYRAVATPMLIGMANKDNFDLEDEWVDSDTNIYVEDINQVKPMPINGISQGGIALLNIVNKGMEEDSIDAVQGGRSGSGATAREIVISNERADELKGLVYLMLKDLWKQKYRLRITNLLMNLNSERVKKSVGEDGQEVFEKTYKTFRNKNAKLSDGSVGTKQIEIVESVPKGTDFTLDVREEQAKLDGQKTEILQVTSKFLDEWEYEVELVTQSFHQKSRALDMAITDEKIKGVATLFPEIFVSNKNEFFTMWMEKYGDNPDEFLKNAQAPNPMEMMEQMAAENPQIPQQAGAPALPTLSGT